MTITTRRGLTLAHLTLMAGVAALPRLAGRVLPTPRRSRGHGRPTARAVVADLGALLLAAPAAYALAGYALRPAREALA